jgi:hypothetical protein
MVGPVGDIQLIEDAIDVVANGFWAYRQLACDHCIVEAASDQFEDLTLALREFGKRCPFGSVGPALTVNEAGDLGQELFPRWLLLQQVWLRLSSGTNSAPAIELATKRPSPNGTRASFRACNTSVGQLTCGNNSVTSMASNPRISPTAFSGEVDMHWRSVNQRNCSGVLSGMNIVV